MILKRVLILDLIKKQLVLTALREKDHYHIENPNAIGKSDKYLYKNGNPCAKVQKASHIIP